VLEISNNSAKMKSRLQTFCFLSIGLALAVTGRSQMPATAMPRQESKLVLWYKQPAKEWIEALPVGNGRLGAMVFGGITKEQIQLNEDTIWSGGRAYPTPVGAYKALPEIRQLLFAGKYAEADGLVRSKLLIGKEEGNSYETMGDLFLTTDLQGEATGYRRSLDLDTGVAATSFEVNGVAYRREVFASAADQVIIVHFTADHPGQISLGIELQRPDAQIEAVGRDTLIMSRPVSGADNSGVKFATVAKAVTADGEISTEGSRLVIRKASEVTLLLAAATNYNHKTPLNPLASDFHAQALSQVQDASTQCPRPPAPVSPRRSATLVDRGPGPADR